MIISRFMPHMFASGRHMTFSTGTLPSAGGAKQQAGTIWRFVNKLILAASQRRAYRATMMASHNATISSKSFTACGFSIFAMT